MLRFPPSSPVDEYYLEGPHPCFPNKRSLKRIWLTPASASYIVGPSSFHTKLELLSLPRHFLQCTVWSENGWSSEPMRDPDNTQMWDSSWPTFHAEGTRSVPSLKYSAPWARRPAPVTAFLSQSLHLSSTQFLSPSPSEEITCRKSIPAQEHSFSLHLFCWNKMYIWGQGKQLRQLSE